MFVRSVLTVAGLLVCGLAWSAERPAEKKDLPLDQEFARQAAQINALEVKLGKLAQDQASDRQVKAFAEKMVKQHGDANAALRTAVGKKVELSEELSGECKECYDKLAKLKGPTFDKAYMEEMVKGHEKALKLFENQAANGKDPALKEYAAKMVPDIKEHLKMAQDWVKGAGK
jgi:putative membrane protein